MMSHAIATRKSSLFAPFTPGSSWGAFLCLHAEGEIGGKVFDDFSLVEVFV